MVVNSHFWASSAASISVSIKRASALRARQGGQGSWHGVLAHALLVGALLQSPLSHAQQPSPDPSTGPAATFYAPAPDIRVAIALPPLQNALASLKNLHYHGRIKLGEYGCGERSEVWAELRESPALDATYSFNPANGDSQLRLWSTVKTRLGINCGSILINNARFDIETNLDGTVGAIPPAGFGIPYTSRITSAGPINGLLTDWFLHPGSLPVKLPFDQPGTIPLCFSQPADASIKPEAPDVFQDAEGRSCRPLPYAAHLGGIGTPAGKTLLFDLSVDNEHVVPFSTPEAAHKLYEDNIPPFEPRSVAGVSVSTGFFGEYAARGSTASGVLKHLLPVRIKTTVKGHFLFFKYKKTVEALLDEGHVDISREGVVTLRLSSHWVSINGGAPIVSDSAVLGDIGAQVVLDRLRADGDSLAFRVADFRVTLRMRPFLIPVKLSSGQLEDTLNHGHISLTALTSIGGDAPMCIPVNQEKFDLWPGSPCPSLERYMIYERNNRHLALNLDPASFSFRLQNIEVEKHQFSFIQGAFKSK